MYNPLFFINGGNFFTFHFSLFTFFLIFAPIKLVLYEKSLFITADIVPFWSK